MTSSGVEPFNDDLRISLRISSQNEPNPIPLYNHEILASYDLFADRKLNKCKEIVKLFNGNQLAEKYLQIEYEYQSVMNKVELPMTNIHQDYL